MHKTYNTHHDDGDNNISLLLSENIQYIINNIPTAFCLLDTNAQIVYHNREFQQLIHNTNKSNFFPVYDSNYDLYIGYNVFNLIDSENLTTDLYLLNSKFQCKLNVNNPDDNISVTIHHCKLPNSKYFIWYITPKADGNNCQMSFMHLSNIERAIPVMLHEIGNMFAIMLIIIQKIKSCMLKFQTQHIENINDPIKYLNNLDNYINRIIDIVHKFLRLQQHNSVVQKINLSEYLPELINSINMKYYNKVPICYNHNRNINAYVDINITHLQQIIINLISNSYEVLKNKQNPMITVSVDQYICRNSINIVDHSKKTYHNYIYSQHNCLISSYDNEHRVHNNIYYSADMPIGVYHVIRVTDNGCGINSSQLSKIFQPFVTTKDKYGSGLGLYIVNNLVAQYNGIIVLGSLSGLGTTFNIYFPKQYVTPQVRGIENYDYDLPNNLKILVIDDESVIAESLADYLSGLFPGVKTSYDINSISKKDLAWPDVILFDYYMKNITGADIIKYLSEFNKKAVFLCMSSSPQQEEILQCVVVYKPNLIQNFNTIFIPALRKAFALKNNIKAKQSAS